jgi:hypothetical protein
MTSICNGGDADVWQSLVVLVRPVLECAKTLNYNHALLHLPEVVLSGWKMPLSPNFQSGAIVNALVGMDS